MESFPRRCTRVEWAEVPLPPNPGAAPTPKIVSNVINAAMSCNDKKALVVGGVNPRTGRSIAQTLEYDLTTKQWTNHAQWFPIPLSEATMCPLHQPAVGHVLFGGWNDVDHLADVWVLEQQPEEVAGGATLTKHPWRKAAVASPSFPSPRRGHSMVVVPGTAEQPGSYLIFGGFDGTSRLNDLWRLDLVGTHGSWEAKWTLLPHEGNVPAARDAGAVGYDAANQRLIAFAGFTVGVDNTTYTYDMTQLRWQRVATLTPPCKRQLCIGVMHHSAFVVLFGHDGRSGLPQVCQLQTVDNKWSMVHVDGDELDGRCHFAWCLAEGGKKILVFGGLAPAPRPKTAGGSALPPSGSSNLGYVNTLLDIELERCETAAPAKGGKK